MEIITVHEHKFLLIVGVIDAAFFGACWFFSVLSGIRHNDLSMILICTLIFGGFTVLGIFLLSDYFRRKLILSTSCLKYVPAVGHSRIFYYNDIERIVIKKEQFIIYSHEGKRLASFELNMVGCMEALYYLQEREVSFREGKKTLSPSKHSLFSAKTGKGPKNDPHMDYILKCSPSKIAREKKVIRILGILTTILCLTAFLFPLKWMFFTLLLIILFYYCLYLWMFPRLILADAKSCDEYHVPLPVFSCAIDLFILLCFIKRINMATHTWILFSLALTAALLAPFLIMLCIKRIKEHPAKLLLTACIFFIISLGICHAINYITVFDSPKHDFVIVTEKYDSHAPKSGTDYYFRFTWHGAQQNMGVSSSLYNSTDVGDVVKVCSRKSIFGIEFQIIHK